MKADEHAIIERAADWMAVLEDGANPQEREAFGRWLLESPRHVEEILALNALHRATEGFDPERQLPLDESLQASVVPLNAAAGSRQHRFTLQRRWAAAAGLLLLIAAVAGWGLRSGAFSPWQTYSTAIGEQRAFDLPDGSIVHLNTHSRLQVRFSDTGRDIRLVSGEALFRVAPETLRPFRVKVDQKILQALGTQFNVYRRPTGATSVAVLEGKVRVESTRATVDLRSGEGMQITANGELGQTTVIDSAKAIAWRERRLLFRKDRLSDVVAEFNRYSKNSQLEIREPGVAERLLSGVFDADDPRSLLQFLAEDATLTFEQRGKVTLIRKAEL